MRLTLLVVAMLFAVGWAGCLDVPGSTIEGEDDPFSISRQVRVEVDRDNIGRLMDIASKPALIDEYRYDFLDPQLVIHVSREIDPRLHTFTFTDRQGATLVKPLSLLTGASVLRPGDSVTVPVHMFSGGVLQDAAGAVLANRTTQAPAWWTVGGYPSGFAMPPGSSLSYDLVAELQERFTLTGIKPKDLDYFIEVARADIALRNTASLTLSYEDAPQNVQADAAHTARPLAFALDGRVSVPMEMSVAGRNLTSGRVIDAGFEVLPATGWDYEARGKVWWNDLLAPVRADLDSASATGEADVIAWLTGEPEFEKLFSCAAKPRSAQCHPTEIPYDAIRETHTTGPDTFNLDTFPAEPNAAILADLNAFLADDVRPGDLISWRVDLKGEEIPGYEPNVGFPQEIRVESLTRVLGAERVDVKAGAFETYKVDQTFSMRVVTGEYRDSSGMTFKPLTIDQKLSESSTWIDQETFVPVKVVVNTPFDLAKLVDDVMNALDAKVWTDAPIERLTGDNVEFTTTHSQSMELASIEGSPRMAPWLLIGGLPLFFLAEEGIPAYLMGDEVEAITPAQWVS